jgi:acyl carrier protein phosphodiesterase
LDSNQVVLTHTLESFRYAFQFCSLASAQLKSVFDVYVHDLEIRWNQYFTVRICQIFVQYCKTILFVSRHRSLGKFVGLALTIQETCFQQYRENDKLRNLSARFRRSPSS